MRKNNNAQNPVRKALKIGNTHYLETDEEVTEIAEGDEIINLQEKELALAETPAHGFISVFKPSVLMGELIERFNANDHQFRINNKTWKVQVDMT